MVSLETEPTRSRTPKANSVPLVWIYGGWSLLASLLIFWVELMVAKMLLPRFGGSPSVWNTSLVFFQVTLLIGYAAAHFLSRLSSKSHKVIQAALVGLPLLTLPVALPSFLEAPTTAPTVAVLLALTLMVGAPFFALSTSTPTLQAWFSHSAHRRASDPYFLYALSNVGSVIGLLGYPLLIERNLTLGSQATLWVIGYAIFASLTVVGSFYVGRWQPAERRPATKPSLRRRLRWAAIAFIPSLALLGVTRHISTDVAAFPLMWTVPLTLYLASFVITFRSGGERWTRIGERAVRLLVIPTALLGERVLPEMLWLTMSLLLLLLAAVSIAAHGTVYRDRPAAASLTDFYLWVSIGGAAGGMFASLLAPVLFDSVMEYSLALALAALMAGPPLRKVQRRGPLAIGLVVILLVVGALIPDMVVMTLVLGVAGIIAVETLDRVPLALTVSGILIAASFAASSDVVFAERTFFGVYRIHESEESRVLRSGTTFHGMQPLVDGHSLTPTVYYHRSGPAGDVFGAMPDGDLDVGIIGLGVAALTPYTGSGDRLTYYEIDPVVVDIAQDDRYFTLLEDPQAAVEIVVGDGRLELERRDPEHDLLVVDAFSSDAIPVHLLTVEAFGSYFDSLDGDGALLLHISNRYFQLEPVVGRIAEELDATARIRRFSPGPGDEYASPSTWMIVERGSQLELPDGWGDAAIGSSLWTDDYSDILSVIDWG